MARLLHLPPELMATVLNGLGFQELATLTRTNRYLEALASPYLLDLDAICWAAQCGQLRILRKALQTSDVDLSGRDTDVHDRTPLYYATKCYEKAAEKTIQLLLKAGADIDYSGWNETPLEEACDSQNFRAAMVLLKAGADIPDHLLLACVSTVKAKSAGGFVPDNLVADFTRLQKDIISELVVKKQVDIDERPHGEESETALMRAVSSGEPSTITFLLALGADVNALGGNKTTAFMLAVQLQKLEVVKILLAAGADVNLLNDDRVTAHYSLPPSDVTLSQDNKQIWTLLLNAGSNIIAEYWWPSYGLCSLFELAVYEAWQGRKTGARLDQKTFEND